MWYGFSHLKRGGLDQSMWRQKNCHYTDLGLPRMNNEESKTTIIKSLAQLGGLYQNIATHEEKQALLWYPVLICKGNFCLGTCVLSPHALFASIWFLIFSCINVSHNYTSHYWCDEHKVCLHTKSPSSTNSRFFDSSGRCGCVWKLKLMGGKRVKVKVFR